jgi:hypothetical protein
MAKLENISLKKLALAKNYGLKPGFWGDISHFPPAEAGGY